MAGKPSLEQMDLATDCFGIRQFSSYHLELHFGLLLSTLTMQEWMLRVIESMASIHSLLDLAEKATTRTSIQLTLAWFACFALADPMSEFWFLAAALMMAIANAFVMLRNESLEKFQDILFKVSVSTGWVLILPFLLF